MKKALEGSDPSFSVKNGVIYRMIGGLLRIFVPEDANLRRKIIAFHHDGPEAGHTGARKTLEKVSRAFWWLGMGDAVAEYVKSCVVCQRTKRSTQRPVGNPSPFSPPEGRWEVITMDKCGGLPITSR